MMMSQKIVREVSDSPLNRSMFSSFSSCAIQFEVRSMNLHKFCYD
jgi:hypothetical protein